MKKITILATAVLSGCLSYAQQPVPFPTSNVKWTTGYYYSDCNDGPIDTLVYNYELSGDTTFASISYKKLVVSTLHSGTTTPVFVGALREDSRKIFYKHFNNDHLLGPFFSGGQENLLYDFNAAAGDVVAHNDISTSTVQSVDSVLMGGIYRKRLNIGNTMGIADRWVDGAGSTGMGLISKLTPIPTCGVHVMKSVCFTENNSTLFLNPEFRDCDAQLPLTAIVKPSIGSLIRIFPNPATSGTIHISNVNPSAGLQLKIIDYTGRVLSTTKLKQQDNVIRLPLHNPFHIFVLSDQQGRTLRVEKVIGG